MGFWQLENELDGGLLTLFSWYTWATEGFVRTMACWEISMGGAGHRLSQLFSAVRRVLWVEVGLEPNRKGQNLLGPGELPWCHQTLGVVQGGEKQRGL